ncbi:hypothetical protein RJ641_025974 [Dillenia turbinata]|uniref:Uncharacterized protein n=1 Tax=Dillenia turbinata TaxID=194707 RepID=A0AAN8WAR6_9MAGN
MGKIQGKNELGLRSKWAEENSVPSMVLRGGILAHHMIEPNAHLREKERDIPLVINGLQTSPSMLHGGVELENNGFLNLDPENYYSPDLKNAALAKLSAVHRSLKVAKFGVKKRSRQSFNIRGRK